MKQDCKNKKIRKDKSQRTDLNDKLTGKWQV